MSELYGAHVQANGIRQHYLHLPSDGPRVLFVPGIVSPAVLWQHVGEWLRTRYDCFVLDVRGRGLSEAGAHLDYGLQTCAQDVLAFVRALQIAPVIVVGHSMGARIAVQAAAVAPELMTAVVLLDPPTSGPGRAPYPVPKERTLELLRAARRGQALEAMRASPARAWPAELQRLRAQWLCTCDERAVHVAYDDFHNQDLFADLARVEVPAYLVAAGHGAVVSDADIELMRLAHPRLSARRLPGVGHQMQAEDFAAFSRVLDEILLEIQLRGPTRSHP